MEINCLSGKSATLTFPFPPYAKDRFRDGPAPDTVYIAHQALWALGANVCLMDVEDCQKQIINGNKPDFVLEISGFAMKADFESLLGSICAANKINYFPSHKMPQKIASDKLLSKKFAKMAGLMTPETIVDVTHYPDNQRMLLKPICGGESQGIREISVKEFNQSNRGDCFVEEYINGIDATFLVIHNSETQEPTIIAGFSNQDSTNDNITTNSTKKYDHYIYGQSIRSRKCILEKTPEGVLKGISNFCSLIGTPPVCRLDFKQDRENNLHFYFLEINTDPTIGANALWYEPLQNWAKKSSFAKKFNLLDQLPIHPSAKAMAFLIFMNYV